MSKTESTCILYPDMDILSAVVAMHLFCDISADLKVEKIPASDNNLKDQPSVLVSCDIPSLNKENIESLGFTNLAEISA